MIDSLLRRCVAEFVATTFLVLIGCGVVVVGGRSESLTHEGVALVWGLVVLVLIYAIGDISGCHINPAVTLAFWLVGRFPAKEVLPYVIAQFAGATTGAVGLRLAFGEEHTSLGATLLSEEVAPALGLSIEFVLTMLLMFVVMGVSTGAKEKSITAGLAVGATIGMEAMSAGPLTGASMNPARSFGPAIASGQVDQLWIYLLATPVGAAAGGWLYRLIRPPEGP